MIAVLQRVHSSSVETDGKTVARGGAGLLLLVGVEKGDDLEDVRLLSDKILKCRIFSDENGKMNLSVCDIDGDIVAVSNFTLLASYRKGNRPDYMNSAAPDEAKRLYDAFCDSLSERVRTQRGVFGADMKVSMCGDGPVTIVMDSRCLKKER